MPYNSIWHNKQLILNTYLVPTDTDTYKMFLIISFYIPISPENYYN